MSKNTHLSSLTPIMTPIMQFTLGEIATSTRQSIAESWGWN